MRLQKKSDFNISQHSECGDAVGRRWKNVTHSNLSDLIVLDESSSSFIVSSNQTQAELLPKTRYYLRNAQRHANRGDQANAESLSQQQAADPRAQRQGFKETDQPKSQSTGQKRSINPTVANTPQRKRQRTQGTKIKAESSGSSNKPHCARNDFNISQHSECGDAVGRRLKNVTHSNLSDLIVLDESSSSFIVSSNQPQAELLPKTRYYLRNAQRHANRGDQANAESLSQQQAADPRAQRQGFKETDQPKSQSTGQKRSINPTVANTPQRKRQRTQGTKIKAESSGSSNKPHCARNEHLKVYELGKLLGTGSFGSVFAGIRKKDRLPVAIKYVSKQKVDEKLEINGQGCLPIEIALMIMVNTEPSCSNIVQMLEWYDDPEYYIMILERPRLCEDLANFCEKHDGSLTESTARIVMFQLMKALKHCKNRGVLHCDVKPENILIQTDTLKVKLFDFGCGDVIKESYTEFAGTIEYTPPEWFIQKRFLADPTTVWSVGVTLYRLVCGSLPFRNRKAIKEGHLRFTKNLSRGCSHLIRWCLRNKAAARPSLEQLELHHWFHIPDRQYKLLDTRWGRLH